AHHHLWDRREGRIQRRYMIDEIMADIASGHTIVSTVFIEHLSFFRAEGPDAMKYVGEVEFANGMAAMAASGLYGKTHGSAGISGYADMRMGARVREVLEAELRAAPDRLKVSAAPAPGTPIRVSPALIDRDSTPTRRSAKASRSARHWGCRSM